MAGKNLENSNFNGQQRSYTLGKMITEGGEGQVYNIQNEPNLVIKIYLEPENKSPQEIANYMDNLEAKITYMKNNPPAQVLQPNVRQEMAWPIDILQNAQGKFVGFVMYRLVAGEELSKLYSYNPDKPAILIYKNKVQLAINICAVISNVHSAGYVFGDFNPKNIAVDKVQGYVSFFDTDSYHIIKPNVEFRCNVCMQGYVSPELISRSEQYKKTHPQATDLYATLPLPTFTQETDRFALAVHIFKLLMNGFSPFDGLNLQDSPSTTTTGSEDKRVANNLYCFKQGKKHRSPAVPRANELPSYLMTLFDRAFVEGHGNPKARPTPQEWTTVLIRYFNELKPCPRNPSHQYYNTIPSCPFCEADIRFKKNQEEYTKKQHAVSQNVTRQTAQQQQRQFQQQGQFQQQRQLRQQQQQQYQQQQQNQQPLGNTYTPGSVKLVQGGMDSTLFYGLSFLLSVMFSYFFLRYYDFDIFAVSQLKSRTVIEFLYNITSFLSPWLLGISGLLATLTYCLILDSSMSDLTLVHLLAAGLAAIYGIFITYWLMYITTVVLGWSLYLIGVIVVACFVIGALCGN